ncbi:hypothetical protein [uncultured Dubosiella sp.]|uniref:hypothetical protein n=1 Tax=uncultured Dubosiella sp. TaxID=1937011 RepID=UPI00259AFADD|nr:hypothetical protein [uncultured Dubosiella sp.]
MKNPKIETHPTVRNARAEIARIREDYYQAVVDHHFRRAGDLNRCIKQKEKELRRTIQHMEEAQC